MDERILKRSLLGDKYFQSFYELFPYSKNTPYSDNRLHSESNNVKSKQIERQSSEKYIHEVLNETDYEVSLSSAESKNQLPCLKGKKQTKQVGLPYRQEIKRNKKLLKSKRTLTSNNWHPNPRLAQKVDDLVVPFQPISRPTTCSSSNTRGTIKKSKVVNIQSSCDLKGEALASNRPVSVSRNNRIILKSKPANERRHSELTGESGNNDKYEEFYLERQGDLNRISFTEDCKGEEEEVKIADTKEKCMEKIKELEGLERIDITQRPSTVGKSSVRKQKNYQEKYEKKIKGKIVNRVEEKKEKLFHEQNAKPDKKEKAEKTEKYEKAEKITKNSKNDKNIKEDKMEKKEPKDKPGKPDVPEKSDKPKRPAMPPAVSEIVTKHRNFNLNQLLNNKNSDFKSLMQEYLRRQGLSDSAKVFIINGPYEFLRKVLLAKGWVENTHPSSQAYDLKWTYTDTDQDYKFLKSGQFYNHFPGNRELTTKSGLLKNLRAVVEFGSNIDEFYPRSYDLGDNVQIQEFQQDYTRTCVLNIIKHYSLILEASPETYINKDILKLAVRVAEKYVKEMINECERIEPEWEFSENLIKTLIEHSESNFSVIESQEDYDSADESLIQRLFKLSAVIYKIFPQAQMEGCRNIWIVKPGLNSRGSGVRCMQGLSNIIDYGANLQARVIQKYVESPLLINSSKFDIRQWVLVTSYEPLTIYFFNNCYLRLCQLPFSLDSLEAYRHLANYSLQKNIARTQEDTVWSLTRFIEYLHNIDKDWEEILIKIHYLVIKTLKAVRESIESRPECFEIYGFDVLIDNEFAPWLLEVNLSPACTERTDWLSEMLSEMGRQLIDIVFDGGNCKPLYSTNLDIEGEVKGNTNEWIFIYKGESAPQGDLENIIYGQLEICGEKLNVKKEKIFDRKFAISKAVVCIQRYARGMIVRKKIQCEKDTCLAIAIQKLFRKFLASEKIEKQILLVSCIKIQTAMRGFLARKTLKYLKGLQCIRYIQAHLKGFNQRNAFKSTKVKRSIVNIQKFLIQEACKNKINFKRQVLHSTIILQKQWRKRWKTLNFCAAIIQYHWRNFILRKIKAIIYIQKIFRGYKERKNNSIRYKIIEKSILIVCCAKRLLARNVVKDIIRKNSCNTIIKAEKRRACLKILNYLNETKCVIKIQKNFRRFIAQKKFQVKLNNHNSLINSLETIQKSIKGYIIRINFTKCLKIKATVTIQKNYKGYRARKYFNFLIIVHESAKIIQRFYRKYRAYRKYQMQLRIQAQEIERKRRLERLRREQEVKAIRASERLHNSNHLLKPISLKSQQNTILEMKIGKKKSKKQKNNVQPKNEKPEPSLLNEFENLLLKINIKETSIPPKIKKIKASPKDGPV